MPRLELIHGNAGMASDQKESIREVLCDMITAALSEGGAAASG